jgi:hypothetical protein
MPDPPPAAPQPSIPPFVCSPASAPGRGLGHYRVRITVAVMLAVVLLGCGGDGDAQSQVTIGATLPSGASTTRTATTAPLETITTSIRGVDPFRDTGVKLRVGDVVEFTATGSVTHIAGSAVGPEGDPRPDLAQFNVIPGGHGALLGRFGSNGRPFVIGASRLVRVDAASLAGTVGTVSASPTSTAGPTSTGSTADTVALFLGINDGGLDNNGGSFDVTIAIRRA